MESMKKWLTERNSKKNGIYIHYNPPKLVGAISAAQLRTWARSGEEAKLERAVLAGQGRRLLAEAEAHQLSPHLPTLIAKCESLHAAVERGSLLELQELLEPDYNRRKYVMCRDEAGVGLLHKAVYHDFMDITEYLVTNYPQIVHQKDSEGRTALHYAAVCRDAAGAAALLEGAGAARGARDATGRTPAGYRGTARTLLVLPTASTTADMALDPAKNIPGLVIKRHNIRIWCHDCDMARLQRVVWEGHGARLLSEVSNQPIVKRFLEAVPYIMNTIRDIHQAVVQNDLESVMKNSSEPVPPQILSSRDVNNMTVMHKAAGLGHSSILKYLVERYPQGINDVDNDGRTPLHYAASMRDEQHTYNLLVGLGADESIVDGKNKTPAYYINRPQEIDKSLFRNVPDAPRTASTAYPSTWDWKLLDNDVIAELNKKSRRRNLKASTENLLSKNYTNTISDSTDNRNDVMKASSTHEFIKDLPDLDDGSKENKDEKENDEELEMKKESEDTEVDNDKVHADIDDSEKKNENKEGENEENQDDDKNKSAEESNEVVENQPGEETDDTIQIEVAEQKEEQETNEQTAEENIESVIKDKDKANEEPTEEKNEEESVPTSENTINNTDNTNRSNENIEGNSANTEQIDITEQSNKHTDENNLSNTEHINHITEKSKEITEFPEHITDSTEIGAQNTEHTTDPTGHNTQHIIHNTENTKNITENDDNIEADKMLFENKESSEINEEENDKLKDENSQEVDSKAERPKTVTKRVSTAEKMGENNNNHRTEDIKSGKSKQNNHISTSEDKIINGMKADESEQVIGNDEGPYSLEMQHDRESLSDPENRGTPVPQVEETSLINDYNVYNSEIAPEKSNSEYCSKEDFNTNQNRNPVINSAKSRAQTPAVDLSGIISHEGNNIKHNEDDDDVHVQGDNHSECSELNNKNTAEVRDLGSAKRGHVIDGRNTQESLIEGIINGEVEQDSQDASITHSKELVQQEVLIVDNEIDPEVTDLINNANMEMLATLVLNGEGARLIGRRSRNTELQAFLDNVPTYMQKINKVHLAAKEGNIRDLQSALDRRKFAIARDPISPNGATPLHVATVFGKTNIIKYLGGRFPETLSAVDFEGKTALHYAAVLPDNGHYYTLLQQLGANSKDLDDNGRSAENYLNNPNLLPFNQLLLDFGLTEEAVKSMFSDKGTSNVGNGHMDIPIFKTEEGRYLVQCKEEKNNFNKMEQTKDGDVYTDTVFTALGDPLIKGLTEVANVKPKNPVAFLASFLQNFPDNENPSVDREVTNMIVTEELGEVENEQLPQEATTGSTVLPLNATRNGARTTTRSHRPIDVVTIDPQPVLSPDAPETAFSSANRDEHGQSMLHFAAARTHTRNALFQLLQESEISLAYRDELYRTARDVSIQANVPENTAEINKWILHLAAKGNTEKMMRLLLEGYDHILDVVDENGVSITEVVAQRGDSEMSKLLASIPTFEESRDNLHSAVRRGDLAAVQEMVSAEGGRTLARSQNSFGRSALHLAVLAQHEDIVAYLAQTCPELLRLGDNLERTPLHYAMGVEKIESLSRILIRAGAKRVLKDLKGRQPSYYFMNKSDILRLKEEEEAY